MGQCLGCCQESSHKASNGRTGADQLHTVELATRLPPSNALPPIGPIRDAAMPMEKKQFTHYSKLPPIKRHSSGSGGGDVHNKHSSGGTLSRSSECSETKMNVLFQNYKDPNEDHIADEGIERFCLDLNVKPEEFIVLVLAWKFNAETMCRFTRDEFTHGCKALKVDSIRGIQSKFPEMLAEVQSNKQSFKSLYRWTYRFGLDADTGQRTLPLDMAISLWTLVYSQQEPTILSRWINFLQQHSNIRGISRDTWDMFYNFVEQVGDNLSSYDDTEAWPSLLDDFVEFENDRLYQKNDNG